MRDSLRDFLWGFLEGSTCAVSEESASANSVTTVAVVCELLAVALPSQPAALRGPVFARATGHSRPSTPLMIAENPLEQTRLPPFPSNVCLSERKSRTPGAPLDTAGGGNYMTKMWPSMKKIWFSHYLTMLCLLPDSPPGWMRFLPASSCERKHVVDLSRKVDFAQKTQPEKEHTNPSQYRQSAANDSHGQSLAENYSLSSYETQRARESAGQSVVSHGRSPHRAIPQPRMLEQFSDPSSQEHYGAGLSSH